MLIFPVSIKHPSCGSIVTQRLHFTTAQTLAPSAPCIHGILASFFFWDWLSFLLCFGLHQNQRAILASLYSLGYRVFFWLLQPKTIGNTEREVKQWSEGFLHHIKQLHRTERSCRVGWQLSVGSSLHATPSTYKSPSIYCQYEATDRSSFRLQLLEGPCRVIVSSADSTTRLASVCSLE